MKFSSSVSRVSLASMVASILLGACAPQSSDEERVRALLDAAESAAEARDTGDVMALVADDYADARGFDKQQLRDFLRGYFLLHPKIELLVNVEELTLPVAGLARARVDVAMIGTRAADHALPSAAGDVETLDLEFRLQDDEWRLTRADRARR